MNINNGYMLRCIELAKNGLGNVAPNPLVGCVIVYEGKILAEGYHQEYGGHHAEVNALSKIKNTDLLKESSLYVNLEPCSHFGKTPPCADLIIKMNIPKVIIGNTDVYEKVAGKGIQKLKSAGVDVVSGILNNECKELNKRFFTFHEKKRPYIILKWAETEDRFISPVRIKQQNAEPVWISNEKMRILVHKWRTEEQAIMVGTNTALFDNPILNARDWKGNNPIRIVIDKNVRLSENIHLFDGSIPTIVLTSFENCDFRQRNNVEYIGLNFENNFVSQFCKVLYERGIQSVIIEGGRQLLQSFIDCGIWDETRILSNNKFFYEGIKAPVLKGNVESEICFGDERLRIIKNV